MDENEMRPAGEYPGMARSELRELIREELEHFLVRADRTAFRQLPIEPVFTVEVACAAVPCSERALFVWLKRGGVRGALPLGREPPLPNASRLSGSVGPRGDGP